MVTYGHLETIFPSPLAGELPPIRSSHLTWIQFQPIPTKCDTQKVFSTKNEPESLPNKMRVRFLLVVNAAVERNSVKVADTVENPSDAVYHEAFKTAVTFSERPDQLA